MAKLHIPSLLDAGTLSLTNGSRAVEGTTATLTNVKQGNDVLVVGTEGAFIASRSAADDGGGNGDFTFVTAWPGNTTSAQAYVSAEPMDDETLGICAGVDAIGTFAGRSTHNDQAAGYRFLSVDGAGGSTSPVVFERVTASTGKWRPVEDPGDIGEESDNEIANPQGYVTDPYIDSDEKTDTESLQRVPWFLLCQADGADEGDSAADATFSRGLKLTKQSTGGRMGAAQIITKAKAPHLFDVPLTFSGRVRNAGGDPVGFALLADTSTSEDPADVVNDWTSTGYTTGNFFSTANSLSVGAANTIITAADEAIDFSLGTTAISSTNNRIFALVWNTAAMTTGETLELTEVALKAGGGVPQPFKPQPEEVVKVPVRQHTPSVDMELRNKILNPDGEISFSEVYTSGVGVARRSWFLPPWYCLNETGVTATTKYGNAGTGIACSPAIATTEKQAILQTIDPLVGLSLQNKPAVLTFQVSSDINATVRYAVVSDTNTTNLYYNVISNWASTTYTAGNFFVSANSLSADAVGGPVALTGGAAATEVTLQVPSITNQAVRIVVWADEDYAGGTEFLKVGKVKLEAGTLTENTPFVYRGNPLESALVGKRGVILESASLTGTSQAIVETRNGSWAEYSTLLLHLNGASHGSASNQSISIQLSTDGGSSYYTASGSYMGFFINDAAATSFLDTEFARTKTFPAAATSDFYVLIHGHQGGGPAFCTGFHKQNTSNYSVCNGVFPTISEINALRAVLSAGSYDAGSYILYGYY